MNIWLNHYSMGEILCYRSLSETPGGKPWSGRTIK